MCIFAQQLLQLNQYGRFAALPCVYPWVPDQADGTYQTPILCADYPDPDVVRVGTDYYLVSSSSNCTPQPANPAFERPGQLAPYWPCYLKPPTIHVTKSCNPVVAYRLQASNITQASSGCFLLHRPKAST